MISDTNLDSKIIIVGSGTFGSSTALHLARRGFKNVTCLDKYPVPSIISAGNDLNKIIDCLEIIPGEPVSSVQRLENEALEAWVNDPVFMQHYHAVGLIDAACTEEVLKYSKDISELRAKHGLEPFKELNTPEDFREYLPILQGPLQGWKGYITGVKKFGWSHAANAMIAAANAAEKLGVKFVGGDNGEFIDFDVDSEGKCVGVITKDGTHWEADRIVMSAGANTPLLLDFQGQLESKAFTVAHIQLTQEEIPQYANLPVIYNAERGFFFEPDHTGTLKLCNEFPGFTSYDANGLSTPFIKDAIPAESAEQMRQYLRDTLPQLADRPFSKTQICWITDSPNRELLLCTHPKYSNIVLATGDSGKSFKIIPIIGKYIADVVAKGDAGLREQDRETWKWRPETSGSRNNTEGRVGGRGVKVDFKELEGGWV